jgi:hypothetical protein
LSGRSRSIEPQSASLSQTPKPTLSTTGPVPDGAVTFGGHHYQLIERMRVSWADAKAACEQAGGHLACPITFEEAQFIANLKHGQAVWLGAYCVADDDPLGWIWLNGEPVDPQFLSGRISLGHLWMATAVDDNDLILVPRTMDGTIRNNRGAIKPARNTNIHGYICEWDQ